jgi:dephospho-CoA kinase
MSTVLALSGKINSGKSYAGKPYAEEDGLDYVSFGDYVRQITELRGLPSSRENWQQIGEELVKTNLEDFCLKVLSQAPNWKPGKSLVIDGIRHVEVSNFLKKYVAPSKYVLTVIEVDEQTRVERLRREGIRQNDLIERIESHSTERQVETILPHIADFIIDGNEPLPELIERLRSISTGKPFDDSISRRNAKIISTINTIHTMSPPAQREILGRLWSEQVNKKSNDIWKSIHFGNSLRVVAYSPEQEQYIGRLSDLLQRGTIARLENESDGTYEIYGSNRTFYVTMTPEREFAALLSSWELSNPPHEVLLHEID